MTMQTGTAGGRLEIERLSQSFGGMVAVADLTMTVEPGELFGIIGPNGAGKTTILNCVNRINRNYSGVIKVDGVPLRCPPSMVSRHRVSRTFQSADVFLDFEVTDFLQLGRLERQRRNALAAAAWWPGIRRDEAREHCAAAALLERHGLGKLAGLRLRETSYGTRKVLDILRAAIAQPRVLLLDEPTSGVAVGDRLLIADILRAISGTGCTLVVVDHDVGFISRLSSRILAISYGRALGIGPPQEILAHQEVIDSYIGTGSSATAPALPPDSTEPTE